MGAPRTEFLQEGQETRRRSRLAGMACGIPAAFEIQKEELLNSCPSCVTVTSPFGATHTEFLNRRDRRSGDDLFRSRLTARLRPLRGELFGVHCRMVQTFQAGSEAWGVEVQQQPGRTASEFQVRDHLSLVHRV